MPVHLLRSSFLFLCSLFICLGFLQSCGKRSHKTSISSTPEHLQTASLSSQAHPINVRYARGFSIEEHQHYTLLNVFNPFQNQTDTLRYLLIPRAQTRPDAYPKAQTIQVPVRSMIVTSATQLGSLEMLQSQNVIKGMVGAKYAYNSEIRKRITNGDIKSFKGSLNKESALNMHPDLVIISSGKASQFKNFSVLVNAGIGIFVNGNWLETTPLGRAEWIKVMGLLVGKEKTARKKFNHIAKRYNRLKEKAETADNKPLVINNLPYKGAWFESGGQSYMAQYFRDARARYHWFDNKSTGGLRLSFETVYNVGLKADVWLNPGRTRTKADILAVDQRLKAFKAYKTDQIYNNNKRATTSGANDFWEKGVVRPDLVLSDLIKILHPGLLSNDSLYFYRKVK
jgi:iron complex transport system substrate-binding protein